ncbi:hypothetical protein [Bifidobacterium myosotis]|uniref:hypothetical protein n=1 Tax=Bifidobacterium myosotis TaxID=1630166 RepID=UPI00168AE632|nr:hypothetical protein [Bifidobacterium myosotis]
MLTRQVAEWDPCAGNRRTMTCRHCGSRIDLIDLRNGWGSSKATGSSAAVRAPPAAGR